MVAVTLSGGGARAAAFGLGVLRQLKEQEFHIGERSTTLLDETVLVSGVSGGSILAAHYAAFGDAMLDRLEPDFLLIPFERCLVQDVFWPGELYKLTSPWYGRALKPPRIFAPLQSSESTLRRSLHEEIQI